MFAVFKEQASIAELKSTVALQQKEMQVLTAQLKERAAQIQKVSAQLEVSGRRPQNTQGRHASPAWRLLFSRRNDAAGTADFLATLIDL
jgi:septal ring factor EnvC (AmiA/AmiB activator)